MSKAAKNAGIAQSLYNNYMTQKQSALASTRKTVSDLLSRKGLSLDTYSQDYDAVIGNILQQLPSPNAPQTSTAIQMENPKYSQARYDSLIRRGYDKKANRYVTKTPKTVTQYVPFNDLASYQNLPNLSQVLNADQITQSLLDRVNTSTRDNMRTQLTNWTNNNPLTSLLSDSADDAIINDIIGTQFKTASSQLDNALKRGMLTKGAFTNANDTLGNQRSAANARLQSVGQGVITQGRQSLQNDIDKIFSNVGNWQVGSNYNLASALQGVESNANTQRSLLEGNLRSALGNNSNFFDVNSAINTGTSLARTGGTNPIVSQIGENGGLADALAQRQQRGKTTYGMNASTQQAQPRKQQDTLL